MKKKIFLNCCLHVLLLIYSTNIFSADGIQYVHRYDDLITHGVISNNVFLNINDMAFICHVVSGNPAINLSEGTVNVMWHGMYLAIDQSVIAVLQSLHEALQPFVQGTPVIPVNPNNAASILPSSIFYNGQVPNIENPHYMGPIEQPGVSVHFHQYQQYHQHFEHHEHFASQEQAVMPEQPLQDDFETEQAKLNKMQKKIEEEEKRIKREKQELEDTSKREKEKSEKKRKKQQAELDLKALASDKERKKLEEKRRALDEREKKLAAMQKKLDNKQRKLASSQKKIRESKNNPDIEQDEVGKAELQTAQKINLPMTVNACGHLAAAAGSTIVPYVGKVGDKELLAIDKEHSMAEKKAPSPKSREPLLSKGQLKTLINWSIPATGLTVWSYTQWLIWGKNKSVDYSRQPEVEEVECTRLERGSLLHELCYEAMYSQSPAVAKLLSRFAYGHWSKADFHYMELFPLNPDASTALSADKKASVNAYGPWGYIFNEQSRDRSLPFANVSDQKYADTIMEAAKVLSEMLSDEELSVAVKSELDPIAQALIWCGIPGPSAVSYHRSCVKQLAGRLMEFGSGWYKKDLHRIYLAIQTGHFDYQNNQNYLGFFPYYVVISQSDLGTLDYERRVVSTHGKKGVNQPWLPDYKSAVFYTLGAPVTTMLIRQDSNKRWKAVDLTHGVTKLMPDVLYGIAQPGSDQPFQFLMAHNDKVIATPELLAGYYKQPMHWHFLRSTKTELSDISAPTDQESHSSRFSSGLWLVSFLFATYNAVSDRLIGRRGRGWLEHQGVSKSSLFTSIALLSLAEAFHSLTFEDTGLKALGPYGALLKYYVDSEEHEKAELLSTLLSSENYSISVVRFTKNNKEKHGESIEPLSDLPFDRQVELFNSAYAACKKHHGSCSALNKDHLDAFTFSLTMCSHSGIEDCGELWGELSQRQVWSYFARMFRRVRSRITFESVELQDNSFMDYPRFIVVSGIQLSSHDTQDDVKHSWHLSPKTRVGRYFPAKVPERELVIKGEFHCVASGTAESPCTLVNGQSYIRNFNQYKRGLVLTDVLDSLNTHHLVAVEGTLFKPYWEDELIWLKQAVETQEGFCQAIQYENLRQVCTLVIAFPEKIKIVKQLLPSFEQGWWVPYYGYHEYGEGYEDLERYIVQRKISLHELSTERLLWHVEHVSNQPDLNKRNDGGLQSLLYTGELERAVRGLPLKAIYNYMYSNFQAYLTSMIFQGDPDCYREKFKTGEWCRAGEYCLFLLWTWNFVRNTNNMEYEISLIPKIMTAYDGNLIEGSECSEASFIFTIPFPTGKYIDFISAEDWYYRSKRHTQLIQEGALKVSFADCPFLWLNEKKGWYSLIMIKNNQLIQQHCGHSYQINPESFRIAE